MHEFDSTCTCVCIGSRVHYTYIHTYIHTYIRIITLIAGVVALLLHNLWLLGIGNGDIFTTLYTQTVISCSCKSKMLGRYSTLAILLVQDIQTDVCYLLSVIVVLVC